MARDELCAWTAIHDVYDLDSFVRCQVFYFENKVVSPCTEICNCHVHLKVATAATIASAIDVVEAVEEVEVAPMCD
jgi:hypothetical protein